MAAETLLQNLSGARPMVREDRRPETEIVLLLNKIIDTFNSNFTNIDSTFAADFVVGATSTALANERVLTDTGRITWDIGTDNQVSADIPDDAITYAKIQQVSATDKILGRSTAGAGDVEEIACTAAGRALLDDAAASDQRTTLGLGTMAVAAKSAATYTPSNVTTSRSFDADDAAGSISISPTQGEVENIRDAVLALADVVGTLIADAQAEDWIQ